MLGEGRGAAGGGLGHGQGWARSGRVGRGSGKDRL